MKYRLLGACVAAACCAAPAFAQGLSRVEVLGLQQQLRDDGCGVTHVTGRMDAMTRSAVKKCESKYSGATDARSMLGAMHIGFENGNSDPTMAKARSGAGMHGDMDEGMAAGKGRSMNARMGSGMHAGTRAGMRSRMNARSDSTTGGMHGTMSDSTHMRNGMNGMSGMRDSTRMRRGRMRDTSMHHDTSMSHGSGGMVDDHKATPMTPSPMPSTNPATSSKPIP